MKLYSDATGLLDGLSTWHSIASLAFCFITVIIFRRRFLSPISNVPGPFLASITRIWHVFQIFKGKHNHVTTGLHEKYGPFVRIAPNEVSVAHPDAPKKLLLATLEKGPFYETAAFPDWRFQNGFSLRDPKEKMRLKRVLGPAYAASHLLKSETHIDDVLSKLFGWMDKFAAEHKPMDLDHYLGYAAYDVVGEVFFSKPFGFMDQGKDVGGTLAAAKGVQAIGAVLGFFRWLYLVLANPFTTWLGILPLGYIYNASKKAVQSRQANPDARFDSLALWLKTSQESPDRLSLHEVYSASTLVVQAGAETVSCALQSFLYHTMRHPQTWQRVRQEIEAEQARGGCMGRVISYADTQKLPYFQACVKESFRLFGPLGMGLQRVVPAEGVTIGGRTFSPGTILSINVPTLHLDKAIWGANAQDFVPDRWFADDIEQKEKCFAPFGLGYAGCPGQHLAGIEIAKICATIVRDYDIRQVHPEQEWKYEVYFGVCPYDWPVYIEKRNETL